MRVGWTQTLVLLAALAFSDTIVAQGEASSVGGPAVTLDAVVVVASRTPEALAQVAASVTVVERGDIERRLDQDIADLVRYIPGLRVDADANRFGRQGFSIRGLGGNRVRTEIDGVPIPDAFAVGQFASAGRDLVDLEVIERVEILRGPASTLYGSDALAGIVAFRTRNPDDLLARSDGDHAFGLRTSWASRDQSRLAAATWAGEGDGGWQAMVLASHRDGSEVDNRAWREVDAPNPADHARESVLGKLVRRVEGVGRWSMVLDHGRQQQRTDVRSQRFAPGRFATTYRLDADDRARRDRASIGLEWERPVAGVDQLDLLLYGQDSIARQDSTQFRLADRTTPFESLRRRRFTFEQSDLGFDVVGVSHRDFSGVAHRQVFGIEIEQTRYRGLRDGSEMNLATGATSSIVLGERLPVRDFPDSRARRAGAFWQSEIDFGSVALLPGVRWERYRLDARPDAIFTEDYPGIETVDVGESSLTPKLGLRWRFSTRANLFLQHARGYRAPPFSDVNIGLLLPGFNYEVRPNPELRAERSRGLEAGVRWSGAVLQGTLSLYQNRYHDLIESRANLGIDPTSGALVFQSINRDRATIRGVEAELQVDFGALHGALDGWSLTGAAAAARGRDTARNRPLNGVDPASAVLGLRHDAPSGRWGGEMIVAGAWRKTRIDESAGALFVPPGHARYDALFWIEPRAGVRINAGIFNLFDQRSWNWGAVRGLPRAAPNVGFFTGPGRSVSLSLALDF